MTVPMCYFTEKLSCPTKVVLGGAGNPAHLPQVDDEAVSLVEALPSHLHLRGSDGPATLDVQQALHIRVIGHHVLEPRSHAPFLQQKKKSGASANQEAAARAKVLCVD